MVDWKNFVNVRNKCHLEQTSPGTMKFKEQNILDGQI